MFKKITLLLILTISNQLMAEETRLIVRAKAKDAKFIGNSIGGAYVIIKNKLNGHVLAEGLTEGSTGNTDAIMTAPKNRNTRHSDENTSGFLAKIDLEEPVFISVEVIAPYTTTQAQIRASTELWLIPGKHILGEGLVLEIPGFIVDILSPRTHQYLSLESVKKESIVIRANVVMMCGCPISPGGIWNSEEMEVMGTLKKDGKFQKEIPLKFVSENLFEASVKLEQSGYYEVIVHAYNPNTGNTGVSRVNYVIR